MLVIVFTGLSEMIYCSTEKLDIVEIRYSSAKNLTEGEENCGLILQVINMLSIQLQSHTILRHIYITQRNLSMEIRYLCINLYKQYTLYLNEELAEIYFLVELIMKIKYLKIS